MHRHHPLRQATQALGRCLALPGWLLLWHCHTSPDLQSVAYWRQAALQPAKRTAALAALGALGKPEAEPVLRQYLSEPGAWQATAARSLGQLRQPASLPALQAALLPQAQTPAAVELNVAVLDSLVQLQSPTDVDAASLEKLLRVLQNPQPESRLAALRACTALRLRAAAPLAMQIARDHSQPQQVEAALTLLGAVGADAAAELLVQALYYPQFHASAAAALEKLSSQAVIPPLVRTLQRHNPNVENWRDRQGHALPAGQIEATAAQLLGRLHATAQTPAVAAATLRLYHLWQQEAAPAASLASALTQLCQSLAQLDKLAAQPVLQVLQAAQSSPRLLERPAADNFAMQASQALASLQQAVP